MSRVSPEDMHDAERDSRRWTAVWIGVGVVAVALIVLATDIGQRLWPWGHDRARDAIAWVGGAAPSAAGQRAGFEPALRPAAQARPVAEAPPATPSDWAEANPPGAQVCVKRWSAVGGGAPVGYCAAVLEHDAVAQRVKLRAVSLERVESAALQGECGTAEGVYVGQILWVPAACAR